MNTLKYLISRVKDPNVGLRERLFILTTSLVAGAVAAVFIWNIVILEDILKILCLGAAFTVVTFMMIICVKLHKIQLGAILVSCGTLFIVLPTEFFTGGGLYSCVPIWYVFIFMFIALLLNGKAKYIMLAAAAVSSVALFNIAYLRPELVTERSLQNTLLDLVVSVLVVGFMVFIMVSFQSRIYVSANELAKKQKKEIEELNKAQSRFFSSMSHEIRTPINTIIGLNEMILREEDISDEVAENAKNIQGAGKMLLTLINDVLDMSKIESGKMDIVPVTYDVGAMFSDIVNMIWSRAKAKGLEFHVDVDSGLPSRLYGDEVRIKQVLINLLNNAVKYTASGSVTLAVHSRRLDAEKVEVIYSVSDTGMGIKKENIPYLFDAFKRVDETKNRHIEGTGLGLSIVKQLANLMGGEISVNSIYTKGSTFVMTLIQTVEGDTLLGDLRLEDKRSLGEREHYKQSFEAPEAKVLIVDDNETNLLVESKLLRGTKVRIQTSESAADCLKKTAETKFDCIFMDHLMPETDGIECLHKLRSQSGGLNRETPVVVLTANAGSENKELYRRSGFDGYLLKPVSGINLEGMLLKHLPRELVTLTAGEAEEDGDTDELIMSHTEKANILITTDSVCDVPKNLTERLGISVMPYYVYTEGGVFLDGAETDTDGLIEYMESSDDRPRSEPPSSADYEKFFAERLTKAQHIIHISMASGVSEGYANAYEAASSFDNVTVIDSGSLSSGMGLLVLYARRLTDSDLKYSEIAEKIKEAIPRVRTSFVVASTDHLMRAGLLSKTVNSVCHSLMLHPVITLKNKSMKVGGIILGTREHTWDKYVKKAFAKPSAVDSSALYITYVGLTRAELDSIAEKAKGIVAFESIVYQKASPAISINCGSGTFGLLYMIKDAR